MVRVISSGKKAIDGTMIIMVTKRASKTPIVSRLRIICPMLCSRPAAAFELWECRAGIFLSTSRNAPKLSSAIR